MIEFFIYGVVVTLVSGLNEQHQHLHSAIPCGYKNNGVIRWRLYGSDNETTHDDREFPWIVELLLQEKSHHQIHHCGGSLIHPQVVLTAAHCVQTKNASDLKLRAGECDTNPMCDFEMDQYRGVTEIVVHEEFYKGALYNDVALLILDVPFDINQYVRPVCLPPRNIQKTNCSAVGWGLNTKLESQDNYKITIQKISVPIISRQECEQSLRTSRLGDSFKLHKTFLCAGAGTTKDTTHGDGGAPLVCEFVGDAERFYQLGIVSYGVLVGSSYPGVYTDVSVLRGWIDNKLKQRNVILSF